MIHADKYLAGTPEGAMRALRKEVKRIDALLAKSCAPGMYEALYSALMKHQKEELNVLQLIKDAQDKARGL